MQTGWVLAHDFGEEWMAGECVVAADPDSDAEDQAWVMLFIHRRDGSASEFVVLEPQNFAGPAVARVRLPFRVPFGLHGKWFADRAPKDGLH